MKNKNLLKPILLIFVFLFNFPFLSAASGDYVLVKSDKIGGDGRTWEQQESLMKEYYDNNNARNYSWNAGNGVASLKVEQDGPEGVISRNFNATYGIPSTIKKGELINIPLSLSGNITNWPSGWAPDPLVGTLEFFVYSGNDSAKMSFLGQKGFGINTKAPLNDKFEFNLGRNDKYVAINVVAGNGLVGGLGVSYLYEVDGVPEVKMEQKSKIIKPSTKCSSGKDSGTRFSSLWGLVEIADDESARNDSWGFGRLESVLCVDDHVKTGEESGAILSFADLSTFVMKEETHIVLNSPPDRDNKIALVWGKIKANVKKMMKDGSMEIDMSQAVAGIKGTTFILEEDGKNSIIKVIEGTVEFTSKSTGAKELIGAGEKIIASVSGLGQKENFDIASEDKDWENVGLNTSGRISQIILVLFAIIISLFVYKKFR